MNNALKEQCYAINKYTDEIVRIYTLLTDTFVDSRGNVHLVKDFEHFELISTLNN